MVTLFRNAVWAAIALVSLGACASAPFPGGSIDHRAEALEAGRRVADWQLGNLDDYSYLRTFQRQAADPRDWLQAAFYIGLGTFAEVSGDHTHLEAIAELGDREHWGFGERPRHADADAIGQVWLRAAAGQAGTARAMRLAPARARFDAVLADPSTVSLRFDETPGERPCQARWCWSDALFMAPPAWFHLAQLTGEDRYASHADAEFRATVDLLYDPTDHLFYRDSRFLDRRDAEGRKIFWSRGNGWVYAGLVRILELMPADDPRRAFYLDLYRNMSARLPALQTARGYWPPSLLDPSGPPESSGTAFFVYGLAWGVNEGVLEVDVYAPVARRGWRFLLSAIDDQGRLGWVQQVGSAPDEVRPDDTQLYGSGAFLLAASQMARRDW